MKIGSQKRFFKFVGFLILFFAFSCGFKLFAMSGDRFIYQNSLPNKNIDEIKKYKRVFIEVGNDNIDINKSNRERVLAYLYIVREAACCNRSVRRIEEALNSVLTYGGSDFVLGRNYEFAINCRPTSNGLKEDSGGLKSSRSAGCKENSKRYYVEFYIDSEKEKEIIESIEYADFEGVKYEKEKYKEVTKLDFEMTKDYAIYFLKRFISKISSSFYDLKNKERLIVNMKNKINEIRNANFEDFKDMVKGVQIFNWVLMTNIDGGPLNK